MTKKWYHYGMLPFGGQFAITAGAAIVLMIQFAIYTESEEEVVIYDNTECVAGVIHTDDGGFRRLVASCPGIEDLKNLKSSVANDYLYALSNGETPSIHCTQTETTYMKSISWTCKLTETN